MKEVSKISFVLKELLLPQVVETLMFCYTILITQSMQNNLFFQRRLSGELYFKRGSRAFDCFEFVENSKVPRLAVFGPGQF